MKAEAAGSCGSPPAPDEAGSAAGGEVSPALKLVDTNHKEISTTDRILMDNVCESRYSH